MKINKIIVCAMASLLVMAEACQKYYPMVPPPIKEVEDDLDEEIGGSMPYFVTELGSGKMDGSSWDNAMDASGLYDLLTNYQNLSRQPIYVAEGKYVVSNVPGEGLTITKDIYNVKGGFCKTSTWTSTSEWDPEKYPTIFSGDVNGNNRADDGDCALFKVTGGHVKFEGIHFRHGYIDQPISASLKGQIGAGIYVNGIAASTSVTVVNCEFRDNLTMADNNVSGSVTGGPCALVQAGVFKARDTRFVNNHGSTGGRGGAVRFNSDEACGFFDRCLFSGNILPGKFGSAIQLSGGHLCINNSTFIDNVGESGVINGGGAFLIVNTTVLGDSQDRSDYIFRCESGQGKASKLANNVFMTEKSSSAAINVNHTKLDLTSMGGNIYQGIRYGDNGDLSTSIFTPAATDVIRTLTGRVEGNCWLYDVASAGMSNYVTASNVIDAVKAFTPTMSASFANLGFTFLDWVGEEGFKVDYRKQPRNPEKFQPGSYDSNLN